MGLRVGVVGCGKIADGHVEEIAKLKIADVVAVCDLESLMAEQMAVRQQIPNYYDDYETMLSKERLDVVHITTPPQSHLSLAKQAIDAGCHVYVEKPLTLNAAEARELVAHAEKHNKKLTIGHTFQFDPPALIMRELIAQGVLGDPVHVESFLGDDLTGPFGAALLGNKRHWVHRLPGGLFQNNINHLLYKITEFIPDETPELKVMAYKKRPESLGDVRDEMLDELRVMIRGKDTSAYGTYSAHIKPAGQFATVYGTKSTIHVDYVGRTVTVDEGPKLPSAIGRVLVGYDQSWSYFREGTKNIFRFARSKYHFFSGLNRMFVMFFESIANDTDPPIPYRDIIRVTALMDEIFVQMKAERVTS